MTATILWAYWTSPQADLAGHVERTAFRLISAPLFLAGVGLAHLLNGELSAGEELSAAEPRETARPCLSKEASVVAPSGGRSESIR